MSRLRSVLRVTLRPAILLLALGGCRAGGCAANVLGDVVGQTGDAYCDRRHVASDREPSTFCQEIIDTVALSQFQDDCSEKHGARTGEGRCAREHVLGGCKIHKENDDGSEVYDWYYDTSELEDAGDASIDVREPLRTVEEVKALCVDPSRYEEGAHFVEP